jgi:integrase
MDSHRNKLELPICPREPGGKMTFTRVRYQQGCLIREGRATGPNVWVFRWREETPAGRVNRKRVIGTCEEFRAKADAQKAVEALRITINKHDCRPMTVAQLIEHYIEKELPSKTPYTGEVYQGYFKTRILPDWGDHALNDVRTVNVEEWLRSLPLANGTKAKLRNLMSAVFRHAIRWEWTEKNPISLVRQGSKRQDAPDVLTATEIEVLLRELQNPYFTLVFVAAGTGLRVSELMGLKWSDLDFESGEINLSRGVVRQYVGQMKTEASRKPVPLSAGLAEVLMHWRASTAYNQATDWIFASPEKNGTQPYWPNSAMEKHVRPAAQRAGIGKRIGWHTFRHSYATLLKANGEDVKTVQESLRHASSKVTLDCYTQGTMPAKLAAQRKVVEAIRPRPVFPFCSQVADARIASD